MKKVIIAILMILVILSMVGGCVVNQGYSVTKEEYDFLKSLTPEQYEKLSFLVTDLDFMFRVIDYCEGRYFGEIDYNSADVAMAVAFVNSLDRYSYLQLASSLVSQSTAGIGLSLDVTIYNEYRINYVHPNTPASAASEEGAYYMQRGDQIYAINGYRVEGASFSYFSAVSVGGAGTQLTLTIKRGNDLLDEDFICTKQNLILKEAYYIPEIDGIPESVGYIKLISFSNSAVADFQACISQFNEDEKEYLILDLRGNGGGSSSIMSEIASYLINDSEGSDSIPIIELENKDGTLQEFKTTHNQFINVPIVVLVNSRSASASEALTSAMSFYNTATVIGEKTYGKGTALNSPATILDRNNIPYGISIVIGKYYVYSDDLVTYPDGKWCIEGIGLTPDIIVTDREFRLEMKDDPDIVAAIQFLFPE